MRSSCPTADEPQQRNPAEPLRRHHGGQRLAPARAAGLGRTSAAPRAPTTPPRRRAGRWAVAVLEHVLEVVGQPPQSLLLDALDGGRGERLLLVVDELRERVLGVAHPGAEQRVRLPGLLLDGRVLQQRHQPAAQRPGEQVVEVLGGPGVGARVALHSPARDGHVRARGRSARAGGRRGPPTAPAAPRGPDRAATPAPRRAGG